MAGKAPKWATAPFRRALDFTRELDRLLHMSMQGISMLRGVPQAMEVLAEVDQEGPEARNPSALQDARLQAEFAQAEIHRGFPLLHAHAVISLYGAIEVLIEDVVVAWLLNDPKSLDLRPVKKVRISVVDFDRTNREERMRLVSRELFRVGNSDGEIGEAQGIDKLERVLDIFGLSGPVDRSIKTAMFELHHVRNVLVHRGARADRRLIEACPWLNLSVDDPLVVTHSMYQVYADAMMRYVVLLIRRVGAQFGVELSTSDESGPDVSSA